MTTAGCEQITLAALTDYAAGELSESEASAIEEHLFSCDACARRAAELDALATGVRNAVRSSQVAGFVTDEILNKLARDGVRVRSFTLTPGAVVPCAVWDGDELTALRLRGEFGGATEITLSQTIAGAELNRATGQIAGSPNGEIIHAVPSDWLRQLSEVDVQIVLTASENGEEREVGRYTLRHGGLMQG